VEKAILCGAVSGINVVCHTLLGLVNAIKHMLPYMLILRFFAYILMPFKSHRKSREFFINSGKLLGRAEFMAWFSLVVHDMNALKNLKGLKDKVLFITGSEDFVFIAGVKKKYRQIKDAKLKILDRCGHVCSIQKWKEFNRIALNYLEAIYYSKSGKD
jgi:pimeloyl-ACP methyl ester carboxylesterase